MKIKLNDIKVQSFITTTIDDQEQGQIKGGATENPCSRGFTNCPNNSCADTCPLACPPNSESCWYCETDIVCTIITCPV